MVRVTSEMSMMRSIIRGVARVGSNVNGRDPAGLQRLGVISPWQIASVYAVVLALLLMVVTLHLTHDIPISTFTGDPASIGSLPWYAGALSHVGVLLLCAVFAVGTFAGLVMRSVDGGTDESRFLLSSAALSALLLLDDLFMLHEDVVPSVLGVPQWIVVALYLGLGVVFIAANRRVLLRARTGVLVLAVGLLTASVAFDLAFDQDLIETDRWSLRYLIEDGLKLAGLAGWSFFFLVAAYQIVRSRFQPPLSMAVTDHDHRTAR
jgi:hypothetical protein